MHLLALFFLVAE